MVVLNFWGSWCPACREEAPVLSATARHFQASGVRFMGVDVGDGTAAAKAYMSTFKITYPSVSDPGDKVALDFNHLVPIAAFPSTLVISRDGRITGRIIGKASSQDLTNLIERAVK